MFGLIFHPEAEAEFLDAFNWYEEQQAGLGTTFLQKVESILSDLTVVPYRYKLIEKDYREAVINRFPYVITYKVVEGKNVIFISAIFHTSRNPTKKFRK